MVQLNFKTMEKIKLIKPLWRNEPGTVIEVSKIRAEFAKRKGYAVEHIEEEQKDRTDTGDEKIKVFIKGRDLIRSLEKAENKEYKNKAIVKPKKNK